MAVEGKEDITDGGAIPAGGDSGGGNNSGENEDGE